MSTKVVTQKSREECTQWMERVHEAHKQRSPEACEAASLRIEQARQREVCVRKCKAAKGHAVRSRALAAEGLRQMAASAPEEQMAVQARWKCAQEASSRRQEAAMSKADESSAFRSKSCKKAAVLLSNADEQEDDAMAEAASLVGAANVSAMAAIGAEGLTAPSITVRTAASGSSTVEDLLKQLRKEPANEAECAAKFMLYEGYSSQVEEMRGTLFKFHEEAKPTVPPAIMVGMDKQVKSIDSMEAMGIPDGAREWFVYHMMRQAERNNLKMAGILEGFEKKLEFLASNDQNECPVCLETFQESGAGAPETLGCCHKVCKECWKNWSSVMGARVFCPLCRHDEFLGAVSSRVAGGASMHMPVGDDSDDDF